MTSNESIARANSIKSAIAKAHEDARQGYRIEENKQYGSKEIRLSRVLTSKFCTAQYAFVQTFLCVSMTPFGMPVEPLV